MRAYDRFSYLRSKLCQYRRLERTVVDGQAQHVLQDLIAACEQELADIDVTLR